MERSLPHHIERKRFKRAALGIGLLAFSVGFLYIPTGTKTYVAAVNITPSPAAAPIASPSAPSPIIIEPAFRPARPVISNLTVGEAIPVEEIQSLPKELPIYERKVEEIIGNPAVVSLFQQIYQQPEEEVKESLRIYYPDYRFAEVRSGVDWKYLAIIHAYETRFSLDPQPGRNGYVGAMQRDPRLYPASEVYRYSAGFEFLEGRNYRYNQSPSTYVSSDYREILWAGQHIKERSQAFYPDLPFAEAVRNVVLFNYSANGAPRIYLYDRLKEILEQDNLS